jgi:hypothetical protein
MEKKYKDNKQKLLTLWNNILYLISLEEELFKRIEEAERRIINLNEKFYKINQ